MTLSARGRDSTNAVGGRIANTDYIFLTLTSLENNDTAFDLYLLESCMSLVGKRVDVAFLSANPLALSFEETIP